VLAYSGGVDTSVCIPYLKNEWGVEEVITLAADLGQGDELEPIRKKALASGASESLVIDATEEFVKDYAFPAIQANALYENRYPLSTALARPLIAKLLVEAAEKYGADAIAHGCTGKGNDQVRFDVSIGALNPKIKILAPAREWKMSREETIAYGERCGIPSPVKKSSPYSIDRNLYRFRLHRNDLTAKARSTRRKRRESLVQDDEERFLYYINSSLHQNYLIN
jgi:argininosuccinate synthase